MHISTLGIIVIVVAILCLIVLFYVISLQNGRKVRQDRLRYLLELEAEALASEQTGPMTVNTSSIPPDPSRQYLPSGLMLDIDLFDNGQNSQKVKDEGRILRLEPFFTYIDRPLSWVRTYRQDDGERFDLRPSNGGAVIAIIEWHTNGWFSQKKAYAQVGDQYYLVTENLFNTITIQKVERKNQLAKYNRVSSEVTFFGNRVFRWVISNPLEKPCAFIDQDGIEALVYTGSMSNIRVRNSNLDIVPVLLLLLIYEYHKDLDGAIS